MVCMAELDLTGHSGNVHRKLPLKDHAIVCRFASGARVGAKESGDARRPIHQLRRQPRGRNQSFVRQDQQRAGRDASVSCRHSESQRDTRSRSKRFVPRTFVLESAWYLTRLCWARVRLKQQSLDSLYRRLAVSQPLLQYRLTERVACARWKRRSAFRAEYSKPWRQWLCHLTGSVQLRVSRRVVQDEVSTSTARLHSRSVTGERSRA